LKIEDLPDFSFGQKENLRIQINKAGDMTRGILDYGIIAGSDGLHFKGYLAVITHDYYKSPEVSS
jgi:hypothetical protein